MTETKPISKKEKLIIISFLLVFSVIFMITSLTGENPLFWQTYLSKHQCDYPINQWTQGYAFEYCVNFRKPDGTWYSEEEEQKIRQKTGLLEPRRD